MTTTVDESKLLIDLSAWARSVHPEAAARWADLVTGDRLIAHPMFAVELLHNAITPARYDELRRSVENAFDWVWPDDETARIALRMQERMASTGPTAQRVKTVDLFTAALASQHGLGVLHYDSDYDVIHDRGGEPFGSAWLAGRGTLETSAARKKSSRRVYQKAFGERMTQLQEGEDLVVWPALIQWLDETLRFRGLDLPPPPNL